MIKDVLCRGLEDSEIQIDLLGDKNQDMMEQVFWVQGGSEEIGIPPAATLGDGCSNRRLLQEAEESSDQGPRNLHILWD